MIDHALEITTVIAAIVAVWNLVGSIRTFNQMMSDDDRDGELSI